MVQVEQLKVKIFADGADRKGMLEMASKPFIKGLTTNPTLMRRAGIPNYATFCKEIATEIREKPLSFEVLSDDLDEIERQAMEIASWGKNIYVKIPVTNTKREPCNRVIQKLSGRGVKVNVTAVMTLNQVREVMGCLSQDVPSYVSVFAGRVADTGVDPLPIMAEAVKELSTNPNAELIWASPRELLNTFHANGIGCHIITVTNEILGKLSLLGYDLEEYSLDTVSMFYKDAIAAGYDL